MIANALLRIQCGINSHAIGANNGGLSPFLTWGTDPFVFNNGGEISFSDEELADAYEALKEVIPQMDYDAVEMIIGQLKEYKLSPEDDKKIKELEKLLRNFDWDSMEELLSL